MFLLLNKSKARLHKVTLAYAETRNYLPLHHHLQSRKSKAFHTYSSTQTAALIHSHLFFDPEIISHEPWAMNHEPYPVQTLKPLLHGRTGKRVIPPNCNVAFTYQHINEPNNIATYSLGLMPYDITNHKWSFFDLWGDLGSWNNVPNFGGLWQFTQPCLFASHRHS